MSELKNQIFQSKAEREDLQKIIAQKNLEHQEIQKLRDELKRKKTLISELQALVKVLEAHYSQLEGAKMKEVEDETQFNDKKYEDLLSQYSKDSFYKHLIFELYLFRHHKRRLDTLNEGA